MSGVGGDGEKGNTGQAGGGEVLCVSDAVGKCRVYTHTGGMG